MTLTALFDWAAWYSGGQGGDGGDLGRVEVFPTGDGGGAAGCDVEAVGVEPDEGTLVGQAGHGHAHQLALGQRACPDWELRCVRGGHGWLR